MSDAKRPVDARLDAALARLPEPALPPGLAARIVAQTRALQQDARREDILVGVTPPPAVPPATMPAASVIARPARRGRVAGYGLAGLALAASLAVIIAPHLTRDAPTPDQLAATKAVPAEPAAAAMPPEARPVLATAEPTRSSTRRPTPIRSREVVAVADSPLPATESSPPDEAIAATQVEPAPATVPKPQSDRVAEAGPKRPVQGPPAPIFQNAAGVPVQGMSITGQGPATPGASSPSMGPPPGMGGPPGGPR